jgi:LmbE family N-acetylglucosaminyl deacetylase
MVVLAIGAHPDDLELHCFGALAKFVKTDIPYIPVPSPTAIKDIIKSTNPKEFAEIRCKETSDAAKLIGATYIGLDVADMEVDSHDKEQQKKAV